MPQILAAAASAFAAAAPAAATATAAAAPSLTSVAMKLALNVAISAAMSALQPQVGVAGKTFEWTLDPNAPIPFAAGRVGVAGTVVHLETFGPDKMYYGFNSVLSGAGPIKSIVGFKGDDEAVTFDGNGKAVSSQWAGEMWFRSRLGAQPDMALTSPPGLKNGATLPNWTAAHKLSGKASYMLVLGENSKRTAYPTGEPKPLVTIEGLFGWDPRQDSTWPGGAGACRLNDPATWVWLDNPILWGLKWSLGLWEGPTGRGAPGVDYQVGGIGADVSGIDVAAFVAAANVADANGWKVAAYPTTDDDKAQVLDAFLQAGGAIYAQRAGKISCIQRAAPRTSIVTITARDTAGPIEVDTAASRIDRINTIRARFWSEAHRWQLTAIDDVTSAEWKAQDGQTRPRGVDYTFVPLANQAAQLAALQIAHTREGIAGRIPLKPHLQRIAPGSVFTISEPGFLLNGVECLCLNAEYDPASGVVMVTFVSETAGKYAYALGQTGVPPTPAVLTPYDPTVTPPSPGDWEVVVRPPSVGGGRVPGFDVVGSVDNATATAILVEWGPTDEGPWTQAYLGPPTVERIPLTGIQPGDNYFVAVSNIRNQNTSARQVYGPYTAPPMISDDTGAVDGVGAPELVARLVDAEALAAATDAAVGDLEEVYGDTVSAATSALAADASADAAALDRIAAQAARDASEDAADASVTAASVATAEADEAGLSAAAADVARTAARLTAAALLPSDFRDDSKYWAYSWSGSPEYRTTIPLPADAFFTVVGVGRVFRTPTVTTDFAPIGAVRVSAGRKYRYRLRIRAITDGIAHVWLRWVATGADYFDPYDFNYTFHAPSVADGWLTLESFATGDQVLAAGRVYLRPNPIVNIDGDGQVYEVAEVRLDDITESDAAEGFAEAAALSVTQAEAHSTDAGEYAFAAQGFATEAEAQAGEARTYATQSAEARDDSVEARIEAGTSAATAAAAAATASAEASEASDGAARASSSASLAASVGHRALNPNAGFDDYPTATGLPPTFGGWGEFVGLTRFAAGEGGYDMFMESDAANGGTYQALAGVAAPDTYYVMEATVRAADDGCLSVSGIYCAFFDYGGSTFYGDSGLHFSVDSSGNPVAGGVDNRTYHFTKLLKSPSIVPNNGTVIFYQMAKWTGFGAYAPAARIVWKSAIFRLATAQEVAAGVALPALAASFEETQEVVTDLETNYALARLSLAAVSPGGRAILQILSDTYGTDIALSADKIWYGDNTYFDDATDTLRTTTGANTRVLALGASFGTDGSLTQWEGPSSVAFSAMSRANAYFYLANAAPYLGGTALPGGSQAGAKAFASGVGGASATTTIGSVVAGSHIQFYASIDGGSLDADAPLYGTLTVEEGVSGAYATLGVIDVVVTSTGAMLPGGSYSAEGGGGSGAKFGVKSGSVTYRVTFAWTAGANYVNGATINASVLITPPAV